VNRRAFEECVAHASAELQQGAAADAARHYREALQLNPKSAELQFRLGQCFLNQTNTVAARQYFQTALDLDELIFRADSKLNNLIRAAAVQWAQRGITLCDAETELAKSGPTGLPGREFFCEHVHLNFDGNYRLGLLWAEKLLSLLPPAVVRAAKSGWASQEICERRLGLSDWNRASTIEEMVKRMRRPPFARQIDNDRRLEEFQVQLAVLHRRMAATPLSEARDRYTE